MNNNIIMKSIDIVAGPIVVNLVIISFCIIGRKHGVAVVKENHVSEKTRASVTLRWQGSPEQVDAFDTEIERIHPQLKMKV